MGAKQAKSEIINDLLKAALLLSVTFIVYIPARKAGFIWDDDSYLLNNTNLLSLEGLWRIWFSTDSPQYYPLVFTTFWIEQHIWGLAPAAFHAVNVFLHGWNSLFLWAILRKLNIRYGFLAGLLFAVHPVQVESVAWITERKNVLSAFFYLLSALSFLKYEEKGSRSSYIASLPLFIPALLSKTVTCSLPVALLIVRWMSGKKINLALRGFDHCRRPGGAIADGERVGLRPLPGQTRGHHTLQARAEMILACGGLLRRYFLARA